MWVCICIETNAKSFCENQKVRETGKQALEAFDDVIKRREQVKNRVAQTRAKETEQEKASQRMSDKAHKTTSRAKETEQEKASRRNNDKAHKTACRAKETNNAPCTYLLSHPYLVPLSNPYFTSSYITHTMIIPYIKYIKIIMKRRGLCTVVLSLYILSIKKTQPRGGPTSVGHWIT